MSPAALGFVLVVTAYFIGSIPFGYLCGKLVRGIDIRQHGSGNIGATNVGRVLGKKWGVFVLILDALKGALPVGGVAPMLITPSHQEFLHWQVAAGIATVVGHMFPCWLGFRGGKGVATALGVVACLAGVPTLVAAATFVVVFALFRFVSLASMLASIAFGVCQIAMLWPAPFSPEKWSLAAFSLIVPLLIVVRHRGNIARLLRGEEQPFRTAEGPGEVSPAEGSDRGRE